MHFDSIVADMEIVELEHNPHISEELIFPLNEFLECFTPPQTGRIVRRSTSDFDAHEAFDIPRDSALTFHRKVNPNITLAFQDSWGGARSGHWNKVSLPIEFTGRFYLKPYDPVSGDAQSDHIYHTVQDLANAFPVYVQANASYGDRYEEPRCSFSCGDRMKLIRVVIKDGCRFIECRLLEEPRLLILPMSCIGDFTALPDNNAYLLTDIVGMLPRRRLVHIAHDAMKQQVKIPGLPPNFTGDLYLEQPETFIEASPLSDPGLIIGLPSDLEMMISPDESCFESGQLLNSFATSYRNQFPVISRVSDWVEETSILENHYVKPGVEIVIHGWTKQSKVLAFAGDDHFAIPLTYTGKFRIKPKRYTGVSELDRAYPGNKLRVISVDPDDVHFPLSKGDIIKIKREDTLKRKSFREVEIRCEKFDDSGKPKELKLPLVSTAVFEELLVEAKSDEYSIKDLVSFVSDHELMVEVTKKSTDQKHKERDLPLGKGILLCDFIVEPAVYVSVESPEAPAFHIPLRTHIYVTFGYQLERSASPLLTKNNPRLSTLDRCVEILPSDVFNSLRPQRALEVSHSRTVTPTPSHGWVADGGPSTGWPSSLGAGREFDLRGKARKPPSVAGSDLALTKSKGLSKIKNKFGRKHRSQENLYMSSSPSLSTSRSDFAPLSLPRDEIEYTRSSVNDNVLLGERNVTVHNGQLHIRTQDTFGKESIGSESSVDINGEGSQSFSSSSSPQSPGSSVVPTNTVSVTTPEVSFLKPVTQSSITTKTVVQQEAAIVQQNGVNGINGVLTHDSNGNISTEIPSTPQSTQSVVPPGYALMSMNGQDGMTGSLSSLPQLPNGSPGYMLVPVMSPEMLSGMQKLYRNHSVSTCADDEEDDDDDYDSGVQDISFKKTKFKVQIPPDGNLYHFSVKKMGDFLKQLRVEDKAVQACIKYKVDGKKFSKLSEEEIRQLGILHPVVAHFRQQTFKKKQKFRL